MTMESADLKLDGNAIGGLLGEVFVGELTVARSTCGSCGAVREIGALVVYGQAPGAVMRCPSCEAVLLRVVRGEDRIWLEPPGHQLPGAARPGRVAKSGPSVRIVRLRGLYLRAVKIRALNSGEPVVPPRAPSFSELAICF